MKGYGGKAKKGKSKGSMMKRARGAAARGNRKIGMRLKGALGKKR